MTVSRFRYIVGLATQHLGIASEYTSRLHDELGSIADNYPSMPTGTAIALATFRLFVDTDIKRVIPEQNIIDGAMRVIDQVESASA